MDEVLAIPSAAQPPHTFVALAHTQGTIGCALAFPVVVYYWRRIALTYLS
jgi:hypothetical protein